MTESNATAEPVAPVSSKPAAVPATTTKPQPELPDHAPRFAEVKHPLRFAIHGKKHMIGPLKDLIRSIAEVPDEYKSLLHAELDSLKTNAAQVDLHVVDHANGDISVHAHIKPIQLG